MKCLCGLGKIIILYGIKNDVGRLSLRLSVLQCHTAHCYSYNALDVAFSARLSRAGNQIGEILSSQVKVKSNLYFSQSIITMAI